MDFVRSYLFIINARANSRNNFLSECASSRTVKRQLCAHSRATKNMRDRRIRRGLIAGAKFNDAREIANFANCDSSNDRVVRSARRNERVTATAVRRDREFRPGGDSSKPD